MSTIASRLDVTQIFCDVDDFCSRWEQWWQQVPQLPSMRGERRSQSRMHLSEVMTIAIAFHGSGYRTFKDFYTLQVLPSWGKAFPNQVSYTRGLHLVTKSKKNMKNRLVKLIDKILLRKRAEKRVGE